MSFKILKVVKGYSLVNAITGQVHSRHSTLQKVKAQLRLLESLKN